MSKGTSLKKISTKHLEREITKRKVSELESQKTIIEKKIKSLTGTENTVEKLNKKSNKKSSKSTKVKKVMHKSRAVNGTSLTTRLSTIAADGATRTTTEYVTALENDGWKSTSAKPYYVVAAALATLATKNVFRRVSKGSYQLSKVEPVAVINVAGI